MNPLKRWSESESEVDPVLRAVMRHARSQEASTEAMSALVARLEERVLVEEAQAASRQEVRTSSVREIRAVRPRLRSPALRVGLLFASAGVAWAAWRGAFSEPPVRHQPVPDGAPVASAAPPAPVSAQRASAAVQPESALEPPPAGDPASANVEVGERPSAVSKAERKRTEGPPSIQESPLPQEQPLDETVALESARRAVARDPGVALARLREHERVFPTSSLREERDVLSIEALLRLGRRDQARVRFAAFQGRFPSSLYRRRLQARFEGAR
jgi:hypothetical protein